MPCFHCSAHGSQQEPIIYIPLGGFSFLFIFSQDFIKVLSEYSHRMLVVAQWNGPASAGEDAMCAACTGMLCLLLPA